MKKINPVKLYRKLYKSCIPRVVYSTLCLLLIGLYLSCGTTDDGGTTPVISYDPLGISFFSVLDRDQKRISESDTNAISLDASFLLTFDESLGNMGSHVNFLTSQIKLTEIDITPPPPLLL